MALGFMRRHKGWLKYLLLLVVLAFIILYIPAFQDADAGGPGELLARVGAEKVTVGEFQRAWMRERQRLSARGVDEAMLEQLGLREQVLQSLIDRKLIAQEARRLGLRVDDQEVAAQIHDMYQMRGRYLGADEIRRQLALQGSSEEELTESVREALLAQRLQALVTDSVQVSEAEAEREFRRRNERVKLEYVSVEAAPFRSQVAVEEPEIAARFQARRESYRIPERRAVAYLLLEPTALQAQAPVTDAEIEAFYRENDERFQTEEEACARHILVKVKSGPETSGHTEEEARELAQGLLDQLKAGADFAELARKSSEDTGSASQGGDLGCFPRGRHVPEVDEAVFAMQPGSLSELVKTQHGLHVIQLVSHKETLTRPLGEVKDFIRQTLLSRKVRELAEQKAGEIAAALRGGASLDQVAKEQALTVQKSAPLGRSDRVAPLDSPELLARVFTLQRGESHPEPLPSSRGWAFVSVLEIQPSRLSELSEVRERVREDLLDEKARALALSRAQQLRVAAEKDGLDKAATALGLLRKETPSPAARGEAMGELGSSRHLEDAVFALAEKTLSEPIATASGWALLRVLEKTPADPALFAQQKASLVNTLEQQRKQQLFQSYLERARERFPVERRAAALRRLSG